MNPLRIFLKLALWFLACGVIVYFASCVLEEMCAASPSFNQAPHEK